MKSTDLILALEDYLKPLVEDAGGKYAFAIEPESALEGLAGDAPSKWRVVLTWQGYNAINADDNDVFQNSMLRIYVQLPEQMTKQPGYSLLHATGTSPANLTRIEWVILWMRRIKLTGDGVADCRGLRLSGSDWEPETRMGHRLHRTHRLDFETSIALDNALTPVVVNVGTTNVELREDGGEELREDGGTQQREEE